MDVLQAMWLFRRVAESGSFSVAAKDSRLSQPTVSKCPPHPGEPHASDP